MAAVMLYGFLNFPDAPLRECSAVSGYCGKLGKPHTLEEYQSFRIWESLLIITWLVGAPMFAFLIWLRKSSLD